MTQNYTELRAAVEKLMEFRHELLRRSLYSYRTLERYSSSGTAELKILNDPVWHRLEEVLRDA